MGEHNNFTTNRALTRAVRSQLPRIDIRHTDLAKISINTSTNNQGRARHQNPKFQNFFKFGRFFLIFGAQRNPNPCILTPGSLSNHPYPHYNIFSIFCFDFIFTAFFKWYKVLNYRVQRSRLAIVGPLLLMSYFGPNMTKNLIRNITFSSTCFVQGHFTARIWVFTCLAAEVVYIRTRYNNSIKCT